MARAEHGPPALRERERAGRVEAAYRRHYRSVHRFFLRRTGDEQRSDDLTQDVFVDAVRGLSRSTEETPLLAWLYTVAQRRFVDDVRRESRQRDVVALHE